MDMPLSPGLVHWLSTQGHDAVHANDLLLHQASDAEILPVATEQLRVIITADLDFPRLLATVSAEAPGLILYEAGTIRRPKV